MNKPNKYQIKIYQEYNTSKNNIFIEAGPGSGKTTTILSLSDQTPFYKKSIFLAFNTSIKDEIKGKVKNNLEVSTIHSTAYRLLLKHSGVMFKLNENKTFILAKKYFKGKLDKEFNTEKKINYHLFIIQNFYNLCRMNLCESVDQMKALLNKYPIDIQIEELPRLYEFFQYLDEYNSSLERGMMIDFTDMISITMKVVKSNFFPKYDVVFIDEVQDLNPLQKKFIENIIGKSGRFIAVGDKNQSIYSFMGSNIDSFNQFKSKERTTVLPLSVSYRCPKLVIELANQIFPGIESFEENGDGVVRFGKLNEVKPGDFVICRNNLPLIESFLSILKTGNKVSILGKDLGINLLKIFESVDTIDQLDTLLEKKRDTLNEKGINNPEFNSGYQDLKEKIDILKYLYKNSNSSISETKKLLNKIFTDKSDNNDILLMTGHKSKGLEADRVFYLYPELIPSKYAKTEIELNQEKCLEYVIITRAKKELIIIK